MRMAMRTLTINRDPDFAERLGALLQTQAQFTIILLPVEFERYFLSARFSVNPKIIISCEEYSGTAISGVARVIKIRDISPDEWRSCVGPQNEEALLSILKKVAKLTPNSRLLDGDSPVVLFHLSAAPDRMG